MNAQLKKIGLGMALFALPLFVSSTNAQQWTPISNGVNVNLGDSPVQQANFASPNHTISMDQNGTINGRVASIDTQSKTATGLSGLNVFFVQNNQVVQQTRTTADGSFTIKGLAQGAYSFIAAGKSGIAAYGIYVSGQNTGSSNLLEATTASANFQGFQQLIQNSAPPVVAQSVNSAMQSVTQDSQPATAKQIQLVNGRFNGQVSTVFGAAQAINGVQVHLIQDSNTIAQVETDAQGAFSIPDLEPGIYDFVAVGKNSFAATRFEAVGPTGPMTQISYRKTLPQGMDVALTCPCNNAAPAVDYAMGDVYMEPSYSTPVEYAGESIAYGGASGGSGAMTHTYGNFSGGGVVQGRFGGSRIGGFRRGGGLGRLMILGGAVGGIVAVSEPDDASPTN